MAAKFPDTMEIKALEAILTPPPGLGLYIALYDNDNPGDPTLDISQFFISTLEGFSPKNLIFAAPATDGNSRANSASNNVVFTLGETPAAPVNIYGCVVFYWDLLQDVRLVAWEYFGAPLPVSVNGQSIAFDLIWYCKDAEGVPG